MENTYRYSAAALGLFACGLMTVFAVRSKIKSSKNLLNYSIDPIKQKKVFWPSILPNIPNFDEATEALKLSEIEK